MLKKPQQDHLLLMLPAEMVPFVITSFSSLIKQIEDDTILIVVTHASCAQQIKNCLKEAKLIERCHLIIDNNDGSWMMWIQDHLLLGRNKNNNYQMMISKQSDQSFQDVILQVAKVAKLPLSTLDSDTEMPDGGNLLFDGKSMLYGGNEANKNIPATVFNNIPEKNIHPIGSRLTVPIEKRISTQLSEQNWDMVIHAGNKKNTVQPIFHIDLFISMAGYSLDDKTKQHPRILVGDPSIAARALGIDYAELGMQAHFDDIAEQLEVLGFIVIRNPLPLVYCDSTEEQERTWYFASGNNVVVKNNGNKRIVWLPTYGHDNWPELKITDEMNAEIWEELGYEVRLIDECQSLAENFGGLHCFSKTWGDSFW